MPEENTTYNTDRLTIGSNTYRVKDTVSGYSSVSASSTGTSTTEAKYLTVNGTEYKIGGGISYEEV